MNTRPKNAQPWNNINKNIGEILQVTRGSNRHGYSMAAQATAIRWFLNNETMEGTKRFANE